MRPSVAALAALLLSTTAQAALLPVESVTLSASGLAVITQPFEATNKPETLSLPVRMRDVDDVLKTLVVLSPEVGLRSISLSGQDGLALPLTPQQAGSVPELLRTLKGETLSVTGSRTLSGRIMAVDVQPATKTQPVRHRVTLLTDSGLQAFVLEDAGSLRFASERLQQALARVLDKAAGNHPNAVHDVKVALSGTGQGHLAYMLAMPVWKTAYRLVVQPDGKQGTLQAVAVIENSSPTDWRNVRLELLTGNPVTFRQDLYGSQYRDRPELAVAQAESPVPQADSGAVAMMAPMAAGAAIPEGRMGKAAMMAEMAAGPVAVAGETPLAAHYTFAEPVTVLSGQVTTTPFLTATVPVEQTLVFQPERQSGHPFNAVKVTNGSPTGLPGGIVTVYQAGEVPAFLGDAELKPLPQGDSRLLPFAVDSNIRIVAEPASGRKLSKASWVDGVLKTEVLDQQVTVYRIRSGRKEPVQMVIEQPRLPDYALSMPGVEATADAWRIPVTVNPGDGEVRAVATRPERQEYNFVNGQLGWPDMQQLWLSLEGAGQLPGLEPVRASFAELARINQEIEAQQKQRQSMYEEQARIRENLLAIDKGSELGRRYIRDLGTQEDRIQKTVQHITDLQRKQQGVIQRIGEQLQQVRWG